MNSPWTNRQFSPHLPACTFPEALPGCCCGIACNATSSKHSTLSRIYKSTRPTNRDRSCQNSFRMFLNPGSTNTTSCVWKPSLTIPQHQSTANAVRTTPAPDPRGNRYRGTTQHTQPTNKPPPVSTNAEYSSEKWLEPKCHLKGCRTHHGVKLPESGSATMKVQMFCVAGI